jgi:hypothetical protein
MSGKGLLNWKEKGRVSAQILHHNHHTTNVTSLFAHYTLGGEDAMKGFVCSVELDDRLECLRQLVGAI